MSKAVLAAVAAILVLAAAPAFARHCPKDMAQIDQTLSTMPKLPVDKLAEVKTLRMEGEALHKAGNHPESEARLAEAKKILGIM